MAKAENQIEVHYQVCSRLGAAVHWLPGRKTVRLLRSLTRFWHLWLDKYPQEIAPTGPK